GRAVLDPLAAARDHGLAGRDVDRAAGVCLTRSMPASTTVYSSNAGVCPGSTQPCGLRMCATLTVLVPELTRPMYSSIAFGRLPAATIRVGDGTWTGTSRAMVPESRARGHPARAGRMQ